MKTTKLCVILVSIFISIAAAQTHRVGEPGVTAPKLLSKIDPAYTEEARAAKISGTVVLELVVDENGSADEVQVTKPLDPGLDQNAMAAVLQLRFAPATKDGKPVRVQATIEVNF